MNPDAERSARLAAQAAPDTPAAPLADDDDEATRVIPPSAVAAAIAAADAAARAAQAAAAAPAVAPAPEAQDDGDPDATLVAPGPLPELVQLGLVPPPPAPDEARLAQPVPAAEPPPAPEPEPAPVSAVEPVAVAAATALDVPAAPPPPPTHGPTLPASGVPAVDDAGAPVRQVGRYRIAERLGRGGMASVFRANDPTIGRDVALKFLHTSLCEDEEYRARFLHEARAAGVLSHPNIVTVHDVGEIDGRPYMAMELLTGESLAKEMERGPMPVRQAAEIGLQIARALDYAHQHGIVHRDIKPANIVRVQGGGLKVLDFGIAHVESADAAQRTRVGDVLGTPQYMSPEQTAGEKLDGRSDLFSVGIMLYQMLTGQRPFAGDSLVALAWKIAKTDPTPIEQLRPDLPLAMRRIVERCLAKQPEKRFQSGAELAAALQAVLLEQDEAEREKARDKPRIVPLRVKWAATMALIVAVVMGVSATVITQRQNAAMLDQATSSGATLARFIAAQNAVAALSDDWPAVTVAVQEMIKTGDFQNIAVIDRGGVVRAAADAHLVDQPYRPLAGEPLATKAGGVTGTRTLVGGEPVLAFEAPMTFAGKNVGRVSLSLAEKPLVRVAQLSMGLMVALVVITVAAVGIAMFFVANWFAQPIKLLSQAMREIAQGRYDYRINQRRKDEYGLLYAAFDDMARALEMTHGDPPPAAAPPAAPAAPAMPAAPYPETIVSRSSDRK